MEKVRIFSILKITFQKIKENWMSCLFVLVIFAAFNFKNMEEKRLVLVKESEIMKPLAKIDYLKISDPIYIESLTADLTNQIEQRGEQKKNSLIIAFFSALASFVLCPALLIAIHNDINIFRAIPKFICRMPSFIMVSIITITFTIAATCLSFLAFKAFSFSIYAQIIVIIVAIIFSFYWFIRLFLFAPNSCLIETKSFINSIKSSLQYTKGKVNQITWKIFLLHITVALALFIFIFIPALIFISENFFLEPQYSYIGAIIVSAITLIFIISYYVFFIAYKDQYEQISTTSKQGENADILSIREQILGKGR